MAAMCGVWLRRKVPQPCEDGSRLLVIILGDRRLSDRKAELEQLTMNARRAPEQILNAHPPDQRPQVRTYFRTALPGSGISSANSAESRHDASARGSRAG
jgi:hypothetical protein